MSYKAQARRYLSAFFRRHGYEVLPEESLYDWQRQKQTLPSYRKSALPESAENYLKPDNTRLGELQKRYADFDGQVTAPITWKEGHVRPDDLQYFRGDNAYVWQLRGINMNIIAYTLTAYYIKSIDSRGFLNKLAEDDFFGNYTFRIDKKEISRDLLDSINEIYFLDRHLNISSRDNLNILDIGAGYGRLAHRMLKALPNIHTYYCTDAVAISTFISEYYLRFRKVDDRAKVVPLDEIASTLEKQPVDIAVNIHSFTECSIQAIEWWLSLLNEHRIKYLMIVPNALDHGGKLLLNDERQDISKVIGAHGYELMVNEPKFSDPEVQKYAINPTYYYLFKLGEIE